MTTSDSLPWRQRDIGAITALIDEQFPQVRDDIGALTIEELGERRAVVRLGFDERFVRPGGSVSGPTMFKLADISAYFAILSERGPAAIDAVTATMTINFLARPAPADLICHVRLLRLGRRLAMAECELRSAGQDEMVAHATCTYALPVT